MELGRVSAGMGGGCEKQAIPAAPDWTRYLLQWQAKNSHPSDASTVVKCS